MSCCQMRHSETPHPAPSLAGEIREILQLRSGPPPREGDGLAWILDRIERPETEGFGK